MTNYREILRLHSLGHSQRNIAASCGCGKGTVQRTVEHAKKHGLVWPLPPEMTDERLRKLFLSSAKDSGYYMDPNFDWVHRKQYLPLVKKLNCQLSSTSSWY